MPTSDREVFAYFRRDSTTPTAVDAICYASFGFDTYEWMARYEELTGVQQGSLPIAFHEKITTPVPQAARAK